jgi:hypothetical protein
MLEAKRYTTCEKVEDKVRQMRQIREMIQLSKTSGRKDISKKFMKTAELHQFFKIQDVYLYIGGPSWEPNAYQLLTRYRAQDVSIGMIELKSSRYAFHDHLTYLHHGGTESKHDA